MRLILVLALDQALRRIAGQDKVRDRSETSLSVRTLAARARARMEEMGMVDRTLDPIIRRPHLIPIQLRDRALTRDQTRIVRVIKATTTVITDSLDYWVRFSDSTIITITIPRINHNLLFRRRRRGVVMGSSIPRGTRERRRLRVLGRDLDLVH